MDNNYAGLNLVVHLNFLHYFLKSRQLVKVEIFISIVLNYMYYTNKLPNNYKYLGILISTYSDDLNKGITTQPKKRST